MGMPDGLKGLAGDISAASGGTPQDGAEINASIDLVDVKAWQLAKKGINAITDAVTGTKAFEAPRRGM
ncbi:MAG: hypothetical protein AAF556_11740 [Pseudomonadota bacterium]